MRGRPKIEDSRTNQYRIRLNDEENEKLNYASRATGKAKSDIFRLALIEYYNNVLLNEINMVEESDWYIDGITLKRAIECPYCHKKIRIDLEDSCSISCDERSMGAETLYEFDYEETCPYCDQQFAVSGYISEYPEGALNSEEIKTTKMNKEE